MKPGDQWQYRHNEKLKTIANKITNEQAHAQSEFWMMYSIDIPGCRGSAAATSGVKNSGYGFAASAFAAAFSSSLSSGGCLSQKYGQARNIIIECKTHRLAKKETIPGVLRK